MKIFTAKRKSFLSWGIFACLPILGVMPMVFFADLFNKILPLWLMILLTISVQYLIILRLFFWFAFDFYSTIILVDNEGVKFMKPGDIKQFNWSAIKEATITKPEGSLWLIPKNENEEPIYYPLSVLSNEDREEIQKVLKEKIRVIIKRLSPKIQAGLFLQESDCANINNWL